MSTSTEKDAHNPLIQGKLQSIISSMSPAASLAAESDVTMNLPTEMQPMNWTKTWQLPVHPQILQQTANKILSLESGNFVIREYQKGNFPAMNIQLRR